MLYTFDLSHTSGPFLLESRRTDTGLQHTRAGVDMTEIGRMKRTCEACEAKKLVPSWLGSQAAVEPCEEVKVRVIHPDFPGGSAEF